MSEGKLIIVRHGHTSRNSGSETSVDRIRGWDDIPLSAEGVEDAKKAAEELDGVPVGRVVSSDLKRSMQTGVVIAKKFGVPVQSSKAYRPWNLGVLQNRPSKDVQPIITHFAKEVPAQKVPSGESFDVFKSRFLTGLQRLLKSVKGSGETVVLVTHFRGLKLTEAWMEGGQQDDDSLHLGVFFKDNLSPAAIYELRPDGDKWKGQLISRGVEK